jgi:hypothetical protein
MSKEIGIVSLVEEEGHSSNHGSLAPLDESQSSNHSISTYTMTISRRTESKLFTPMTIGNGKIKLDHRVGLAPLTRNRGNPLAESTSEKPNRIWLPNDLMAEYYSQRASKGGLIITEGVPPSLEVCHDTGERPKIVGAAVGRACWSTAS